MIDLYYKTLTWERVVDEQANTILERSSAMYMAKRGDTIYGLFQSGALDDWELVQFFKTAKEVGQYSTISYNADSLADHLKMKLGSLDNFNNPFNPKCKIVHTTDDFKFVTVADLSETVIISCITKDHTKFKLNDLVREQAEFVHWWTTEYFNKLDKWSGMDTIKWYCDESVHFNLNGDF